MGLGPNDLTFAGALTNLAELYRELQRIFGSLRKHQNHGADPSEGRSLRAALVVQSSGTRSCRRYPVGDRRSSGSVLTVFVAIGTIGRRIELVMMLVSGASQAYQRSRWHPLAWPGGDKSMIKSALVQRIAIQNRHLYQRDVENVVDAILGVMVTALAHGDRIEIRGFGAFSVKHRTARSGRNPLTGAHVSVEPKHVPVFKGSKEMHRRLNRQE
jgi:integration host factor subunit beta